MRPYQRGRALTRMAALGPSLLAVVLLFASRPAEAQIQAGSYIGDGVSGRAINVGFPPDLVIVQVNWSDAVSPDNSAALIRTSTMPGNGSKPMRGVQPPITTGILSLTATGFTVGTDNRVNSIAYCSGACTYHWVAFKADANLKVGTYVGIGATQSITGLGFSPDYLMVLPSNINGCRHRPRAGGARSDTFTSGGSANNAITSLDADGFTVTATGENTSPAQAGVTYHYAAWNAVPGQTAIGTYIGNGGDNRAIELPGFQPLYVIVQSIDLVPGTRRPYQRMASFPAGDNSASFDQAPSLPPPSPLLEKNRVQDLLPRGLEVGTDASVNFAGEPYFFAAFGHATYYRSIGTAANYATGTVTATNGSTTVTGSGTAWQVANRGWGDRMTILGTSYTIQSVDSDTQLTLTLPFAGATGSGLPYTIARQFATLQAWEDCISFAVACPFFPVASANLVADNRSEVGIAYKDSVFTAGFVVDGSVTDATHTITLTADYFNRHDGIAGTGVVLDNVTNTTAAIQVLDDYVTLEWLEVKRGSGVSAHAIHVNNLGPANRLVLRGLLLHDTPGDGIRISDADTIVDVYDNIIYRAQRGIRINTALNPGTQVRIQSNTVYSSTNAGISGATGPYPTVTVRNNISVFNGGADFSVPGLNAASSNNLASDTTGTTHSPGGGGLNSVPLTGAGGINFVATSAGSENLHILGTSVARDTGADLSVFFTTDIDGGLRVAPWDVGADDAIAGPPADLAVAKDDGQAMAVPGMPISYTITVTNYGPNIAWGVWLTDPVPPGIQGTWSFGTLNGIYDSGTGQWLFSTGLLPSQSTTLTVSGTVSPSATGTLVNTATIALPGSDPNPANDTAIDTDTLASQADLSIAKTGAPGSLPPGNLLTYTLTVANNGLPRPPASWSPTPCPRGCRSSP